MSASPSTRATPTPHGHTTRQNSPHVRLLTSRTRPTASSIAQICWRSVSWHRPCTERCQEPTKELCEINDSTIIRTRASLQFYRTSNL